jgi:hypothetical protein
MRFEKYSSKAFTVSTTPQLELLGLVTSKPLSIYQTKNKKPTFFCIYGIPIAVIVRTLIDCTFLNSSSKT